MPLSAFSIRTSTFTGNSNRRAPTAARVIHGPDKVVRFLFRYLVRRYGPNWLSTNQLALVNGQLGGCTAGAPAGDGYPEINAAGDRHDRPRRKGRHLGMTQPGQVHCFAAPAHQPR